MNNIQLIYIDLFCGGGGTTTGVGKMIAETIILIDALFAVRMIVVRLSMRI